MNKSITINNFSIPAFIILAGTLFTTSCTKPNAAIQDTEHVSSSVMMRQAGSLMTSVGERINVVCVANIGVPGSIFTAKLKNPGGIVVDTSGHLIVADINNNLIRLIFPTVNLAIVIAGDLPAGFADGTGSAARFNAPSDIAMDKTGNIYVADRGNNRIRKITPNKVVSTIAGNGVPGFADGAGTSAQFNAPSGITLDDAGNIYVADMNNNRIRKITPDNVVSTFAGTGTPGFTEGPGATAQFNMPADVVMAPSGILYIADVNNERIRKITPDNQVSTLAGDGNAGFSDQPGRFAEFDSPSGVSLDASGNVYVADKNNHAIRKLSPAGAVSTITGDGSAGFVNGPVTEATFNAPNDVAVDAAGTVYIADGGNNTIREIAPIALVSTLAGNGTAGFTNGTGTNALFAFPEGVALDGSGNVYVADRNNNRIRKITPAGEVNTLAGTGAAGYTDGPAASAQFNLPGGIAVDAAGNVYVSELNNDRIRKITPDGIVSTLAGSGVEGFADGPGTSAAFHNPLGLAVDASGNVYVADVFNYRIRKITPAGVVSTFAGNGTGGLTDGVGTSAAFNAPDGVATDASGNVYVADTYNSAVRKITPAGVVSTITGSLSGFYFPAGITVDGNGNIYVTDTNNERIRKINPAGVISEIAGTYNSAAFADGTGPFAYFYIPIGIAADAAGNLYIADSQNNRIRKIQ